MDYYLVDWESEWLREAQDFWTKLRVHLELWFFIQSVCVVRGSFIDIFICTGTGE